jgi:hypothetical protein
MSSTQQQPDGEPAIPKGLADGLGAMFPTPSVPARLDDRILDYAISGYRRRRRNRLILRWGACAASVAGIAAGIIVLLGAFTSVVRRDAVPPGAGSPAPAIARSTTRPTILDALQLARDIQRTPPEARPIEWDINHDGAVDDADPRAIAMDLVKLEGGLR